MASPRAPAHDAEELLRIHDALYARFGPRHWWPGETPFEVCVGAILTQNTAWTNVEKAIGNLKAAGVLGPRALRALPEADLAELLRPAGYFRVKARRLREFLDFLFERHAGDLDVMFARDAAALREGLLAVRGIGPETADSILLYAGGKATFVVDAYTRRIFARHGFFPFAWDYHAMKRFFEDRLPRDVALYNEFHALIVNLGKEHCRARARCEGCPLAGHPHDRVARGEVARPARRGKRREARA